MFPLARFLLALASDGIHFDPSDYRRIDLALRTDRSWSREQLRFMLLALLVKDQEQEAAFHRRFDSFFDGAERTEVAAGVEAPKDAGHPGDLARIRARPGQGRPGTRGRQLSIGLAAGIVLTAMLWSATEWAELTIVRETSRLVQPLIPDPPTPPKVVDPPESEQHKRSYASVFIKLGEAKTPIRAAREPVLLAAVLLVLLVASGSWLLRAREPPQDKAPAWNSDRPRDFRPGRIGGEQAPFLDADVLDQLASSLGYFLDDRASEEPDLPASVTALARSGGFPALVFQRPRQVHRVIVLEDAQAESLAWSPVARELRAGLERRGIRVLAGRFAGVPDRFRTADGDVRLLEDFEDGRETCLLFVFSDGKGLRRDRDRFVLESLARWPLVAWMEPREPRGWDQSTALPAGFGVPVFPATRDGLLRAQGRFLTERGLRQESARQACSWRGLPPAAATAGLDVRVERSLGDALSWAQACAMTMPPLSQSLAEAVRRRFHPDLPRERFERLVALPGTSRTVEGLHFSTRVLAVLRRGFVVRRDRRQQEEILRFLLDRIREAEPEDSQSPAYLVWEWHLERVRLELEPDRALKRLSQLAQGPLRRAIRGELAHAALTLRHNEIAVPLREKPRSRIARQRLWALNNVVGVSRKQAFPVGPRHWMLLAILAGLFLGTLAWAGLSAPSPVIQLDLVESPVQSQVESRLEVRNGKSWETVAPGLGPRQWSVKRGRDYRVALFAGGQDALHLFGPIREHRTLKVDLGHEDLDCRQTAEGIGLTILRCPPTGSVPPASWSDSLGPAVPGGRLRSVGLEIDAGAAATSQTDVSDLLLATHSVDVVYRVSPADRRRYLDPALARVRQDAELWAGRSQLIWWLNREVGKDFVLNPNLDEILRDTVELFDRRLVLWGSTDTPDPTALKQALAPGKRAAVSEADITVAVSTAKASGVGEPVVLVRPVDEICRVTVMTVLGSPGGQPIPSVPLQFSRQGRNVPGASGVEIELAAGPWRVDVATEAYTSDGRELTIEGDKQLTFDLPIRQVLTAVPPNIPKVGRVTVHTALDGNPTPVALLFRNEDQVFRDTSGDEMTLPPGRYQIELDSDIYETARPVEITVEAGEARNVEVPIRAVELLNGRLTVHAVLDGKQVFSVALLLAKQGRALQSVSGQEMELPSGQYRVDVDSDLYRSKGLVITIAAATVQSVDLPIEPRQTRLVLSLEASLPTSGKVQSVAFSPDRRTLAAGRSDRSITLWTVGNGSTIDTLSTQRPVSSVAFSPDGQWLASGGNRGDLKLWNVAKRIEARSFRVSEKSGDILTVAFSPDGRRLASGNTHGVIRLWDVETGKEPVKPLREHPGGVFALDFSPDGSFLASGGTRSSARLWDWQSGELRGGAGFEDVYALSFSPAGDALASGGELGVIMLLDPSTGKTRETLSFRSTVYAIDFSPPGDLIATGYGNGTLRLWDPTTAREVPLVFRGQDSNEKRETAVHEDSVMSVAFSADGQLLASGSHDGTIKIWRLSREPVATLPP